MPSVLDHCSQRHAIVADGLRNSRYQVVLSRMTQQEDAHCQLGRGRRKQLYSSIQRGILVQWSIMLCSLGKRNEDAGWRANYSIHQPHTLTCQHAIFSLLIVTLAWPGPVYCKLPPTCAHGRMGRDEMTTALGACCSGNQQKAGGRLCASLYVCKLTDPALWKAEY
jgi:hypothetical protein